MGNHIADYLSHIGINPKEAAVYLYLLAIDSALPMEIAKETRIKRSTVYLILDSLCEKGLVRKVQRGRRHAYVADDPDRLRHLLESHKLKTEQSLQLLGSIMPHIKATVRKGGEPPIVKFYEGEAAVKESMEGLAQNPRFRTELDYGVFPLELVFKLFQSKNLKQYYDLRITNNKRFKALYTSHEGEISTADSHEQEAIKIDHKDFPISCDISIFEDEVRIHMLGKTIYGIVIKNMEVADTLTTLFKLALKGAKQK